MTVQATVQKVKDLYGFGPAAANLWVWLGTILVVILAVTFFFLSYSLARHKKMVAQLKAVVIQKDAEIYLLKNGFMRIDGKREITGKGTQALERIG